MSISFTHIFTQNQQVTIIFRSHALAWERICDAPASRLALLHLNSFVGSTYPVIVGENFYLNLAVHAILAGRD